MNEFLMRSFLQLKAINSFISVKLSLTKIFVPSLKLCFSLFNLASFFLFSKILLQFFLLTKQTTVFLDFDLTSGLPNLWQASMSFSSMFTFMSNMEKTVFSKLLSSMESGIPLITMLFLLPFWAKEFCSVSSLTIFASSLLHFCRKFWFSSCRRLITVSFKLLISSLRLELPLLISSLRLSIILYQPFLIWCYTHESFLKEGNLDQNKAKSRLITGDTALTRLPIHFVNNSALY